MTIKKNTKKYKHKRFSKKSKKYTKRRIIFKKGGAENTNCPDATVSCNILDKQFKGKLNPTWNTCINMNGIYNHIIYITSTNVLIKSIETLQIPEFYVKLSNDVDNTRCNILIEDKYVSCFIYLCGKWYAMMRLFGKTINTQYLARTEKNRVFFELQNIAVNVDTTNPENPGDGTISIPNGLYSELNNSKLLSTNVSAREIKLSEKCFININKNNDIKAFNVLQRFRQQKLFASNVKKDAAQDFAKEIILGFLK